MTTASKITKKAASKRLTREPIMGKAERSGPGYRFCFELKSFSVDDEELDPIQAAADLADTLVWVINQRRGNHANPNP